MMTTNSIVDLINFANQREDGTAVLTIVESSGVEVTYKVTVERYIPHP